MKPKQAVILKAFIVKNGKVLLLREASNDNSNSGLFDVPGGAIEAGESIALSLFNEVKKVSGLAIVVGQPFYLDEWRVTTKGKVTQMIGTFVICALSGREQEVKLSPKHDHFQWINPENYSSYQLNSVLKKAFHNYNKTAR